MDSALLIIIIMSGRLFQAVGPANAKARLPNLNRVRGTMRWPLDDNRSDDLAGDDETGTHIDLVPGHAVPCRHADTMIGCSLMWPYELYLFILLQ